MGKANRERRRMKEKDRRRAAASRPAAGGFPATGDYLFGGDEPAERPGRGGSGGSAAAGSRVSDDVTVSQLLAQALDAICRGQLPTAAQLAGRLSGGTSPGWQRAVELQLDELLRLTVHELWQEGWQPADLLRVAARRYGAAEQRLLRAGIAAELAGYAAATVDPRWSAQCAEGRIEVWWPGDRTASGACAGEHPGGWPAFVPAALALLHDLSHLPVLEVLLPVPGTALPASADPHRSVDERVLSRVRALLAKAESTPYPAEAETFTAGAQALMARHSIDHALLMATGRAPADQPTGRRLGVENPYEAPKVTLLDAIAAANRCRTVWSKELGFVTVVGFPTDLDTVELLFTSLLMQATTAMTRQGSRTDRSGRSRTRTFRQSFLLSYAGRIRERLTEATREQTEAAAAEPGRGNLLPVLAARTDAVDRATDEMFPHVSTTPAGTAWDGEGWASGRAAADLATLEFAPGVSS